MNSHRLVALGLFATLLITGSAQGQNDSSEVASLASTDWPWWRGPAREGVVQLSSDLPTTWSETENVRWKTPIPGRGHGSVTVLNDRVYLATADDQQETQSVWCLDRDSGETQWECVVHRGRFANKSKRQLNVKASLASSTIATDGERLFINFLNDNAVWTSAIDLGGEIVWQQRICEYVVHQGYGSSPTIYGSLVIVSADNKSGGAVAGLDRSTGEIVWKHQRPEKPNYSSPVILDVADKDQLILTGCDLVTSLDPSSGKVLWETEGATTECVTSPVTDGKHVFSSGGYPKNHIAAFVADGSGKLAWENNLRAYVPSLLQKDQHLFAVLDAGIAMCLRCDNGETVWKKRLGGTFSSSPVLVGDLIYVTSESGVTHIFRANVEEFQAVGKNELGRSVFATPTISGDVIFMRVSHDESGQRQEYLYCIGG